MPKYIDRPDLPGPILTALLDPYYQEGLNEHFESLPDKIKKKVDGCPHFSVTTLARPARQRVLHNRHHDKVLLDPLKDGFWRMFGHVIHAILEKSADADHLVEERLGCFVEVKVMGKKKRVYLHGQADLYDFRLKRIQDYKISKAEALYYENKDEYVFQLNALAYIFRQNGHPVENLQNVYLLRNYDARRYVEGGKYPAEQVVVVDIPVWDSERIKRAIIERIHKHLTCEILKDEELPPCSPQERWESPTLYKAYKMDKGEPQKRAKITSESRMEVEDFIRDNSTDAKGKPVNYSVKEVAGEGVRCRFCDIAEFCEQRKTELARLAEAGDEQEEIPE